MFNKLQLKKKVKIKLTKFNSRFETQVTTSTQYIHSLLIDQYARSTTYYRHYCFPSDLQAVFNVAINVPYWNITERNIFLCTHTVTWFLGPHYIQKSCKTQHSEYLYMSIYHYISAIKRTVSLKYITFFLDTERILSNMHVGSYI